MKIARNAITFYAFVLIKPGSGGQAVYETDVVPLLSFSFFYEFCRYEGLKGKTSMRSYILGHTCDNNVIIGDYMIN